MPFVFKLLQAKAVTAANETLYEVGVTQNPLATSSIVRNVRIFNTAGSNAIVSLSIKASSGAQEVSVAKSVTVSSSAQYIFRSSLALQKNASILISTSASTIALEAVICGVERI